MSDPRSTAGTTRWPRFDPTRWPLVLWHQPVLLLLVFVLGAATAFAYSYAPLHRAKDWRIAHLEERLSSRNAQTRDLEKELAKARSGVEGSAVPKTVAALESRLEEATSLAESRAREISLLERKLEQSGIALRRVESAPKPGGRAEAEDPLPASAAPEDETYDESNPDWEAHDDELDE